MKSHLRISVVLASTCLSLLINMPLMAETSVTEAHQHGHDEHATSMLSLDQGKKWQTDAPLRQGMKNINDAVMNAVSAFHNQTLTKTDAVKLAEYINGQVEYLVANCKLEPQADAVLHVFIGDLLTGADKLSKEPLSNQGLPHIVKVLQQYPNYFDHQGWHEVIHE